MLYRNLTIILSAFAILVFEGCGSNKSKTNLLSPANYDLNDPQILYLNDALTEISGVYFYKKDTSVFAISDNYGYLFKIHLNNNFITQKWKFGKNFDFEDIAYKDSSFYVLESNGNIHTLRFSARGDTITTQTSLFPQQEKGKNEFESLYYDSTRNTFIIICKKCKEDQKNTVSAWGYDPQKNSYTRAVFTINVAAIAEKAGIKKLELKPSAAVINPLTGDLWILSSENMLLVIADQNGNCKQLFNLNRAIFTQPEGITFTPSGDLIISNEAGNKYNSASLLIFKRKKI
jgi:uncharacterized protein YjiK